MYSVQSIGQDAIFTQFFNKRSFYNPAMTGIKNAMSFQLSYKSQWKADLLPAYESAYINFEDAMPCSNVDWGVSIIADREGEAGFSTYQAGIKMSYSLTELIPSIFSQHNIRLGTDWSVGQHRIDFSKLIFSDQIDAKEGVIFPTTFAQPNTGSSKLFLNPGFGIVWQARWNESSSRSLLTTVGSSIANSFALSGESSGHSSSILDIPNENRQTRLSFFAELDIIPFYRRNFYISISPLLFYQRQGGIDYWEIGTSVDLSSIAQTGVYLHNTSLFDGSHTNWISFLTSFNISTSKTSRLMLDFTYSTNYTALQNQVGPIVEVGVTYHFGRSLGCKLLGKEDEVFYSDKPVCPILSISPGRRKMYENVWYEN